MYVPIGDTDKAVEAMLLNFELSCLVLIDPIFEELTAEETDEMKTLAHLAKLQNILARRNHAFPKENPLHLLAS